MLLNKKVRFFFLKQTFDSVILIYQSVIPKLNAFNLGPLFSI
jgi:hypothetical protein